MATTGELNDDASLLQQEGYEMMAAAFEVYNGLGAGFLEEVYQESLERELSNRKIEFESQPKIQVFYKQIPLNKTYQADLVVLDKILVELKAIKNLTHDHEAQLINYLKATGKRVGYLVNFGSFPRLQWKRFVL